jgi:hypothetical protein
MGICFGRFSLVFIVVFGMSLAVCGFIPVIFSLIAFLFWNLRVRGLQMVGDGCANTTKVRWAG